MNISKKTIIITATSVWIIFSAIYIAHDLWKHFQVEKISSAYQQGRADMINAAILQAKNEKCEPFSIYSEKEQVQLININCLNQTEDEANNK